MPRRIKRKRTHSQEQQEIGFTQVLPHPRLDAAHQSKSLFTHPFTQVIWNDKYRWQNEATVEDTFQRVAKAIHPTDSTQMLKAYNAMCDGLWMPGGRIIAGAGTSKRVTLMNCYVNRALEDDLPSIMQGLSDAALTQQQGGGIGTDFSTLRPEGAVLTRTGSKASGPLPFMDMWHAMCSTIRSAGDRRGAMMATLCDTHPDLPKFITAKQTMGRLTNFNVSILVSDAFMEAVREDAEWCLHFSVPPHSDKDQDSFFDEEGDIHYVYSRHRAQDLWAMITKSTYEFSEPGVIFIDRINDTNNLSYCEQIHCTNPCGEQPLPPNGTCNLGAVNLARMVSDPFTKEATFNFTLLTETVETGTHFLDAVIDVTNYPLEAQRFEEFSKRRLGLGVSGLADAFAQLQLRYGSQKSIELTEKIFYTVAQQAYATSCKLAQEKGPYPLWPDFDVISPTSFLKTKVDYETTNNIRKYGLRNGVLLTVAPTGTISILFGNVSSGIEPVFDHAPRRNVRQTDDTFKQHETLGYGAALWRLINGNEPYPNYMVTSDDLTIQDHIAIQAAAQRWVDASISKTINVAKTCTYEEFVRVYDLAYALGCKGCTTYRPSDIRGGILIKAANVESGELGSSKSKSEEQLASRPDILRGVTHKIKWPSMESAIYLTVNYTEDRQPFEVFLSSKDAKHSEWMTGLSLMITAILRRGGEIAFIPSELKAVRSMHDTAWIKPVGADKGKFFGSLLAYIGHILEEHLIPPLKTEVTHIHPVEICPKCNVHAVFYREGCKTCVSCGYSNCS